MTTTITLDMTLAPGATAFRLDGDGDGGRMALVFGRDDVMNAIGAYTMFHDENGPCVVKVSFETV